MPIDPEISLCRICSQENVSKDLHTRIIITVLFKLWETSYLSEREMDLEMYLYNIFIN